MSTTFTALQAKSYVPSIGHGYSGALYVIAGDIAIAANPVANDIYEMCWTPDRFLCLGGSLVADDIDTGTEALDMDLGWAANASGSVNYTDKFGNVWSNSGSSLSASGFINAGVWDGDAITDLHPAGQVWYPVLLPTPLFFHSRTKVQVKCNVTANAFTAGHMQVHLWGLLNP